MKKATQILSIIAIVVTCLVFVSSLLEGIFAPSFMNWYLAHDSSIDAETANYLIRESEIYSVNGFVNAGIMVIGIVISILLFQESKIDPPNRNKMLAFGILECIFGFIPAGVVAIIHAAKDGIS